MGTRRVQQDEVQLRIRVNGNEVKNTLKDIGKEYRTLIKLRNESTRGSDDFKRYDEEARRLKGIIDSERIRSNELKNGVDAANQRFGILGNTISGIGNIAKTAFAPLLALGSISALKGLVGDLTQATVSLETFEQKSKTVFGEALIQVQDFADTYATDLGLTENQLIATTTAAGDLLVPMGFQREEAAALSIDLVGLSGALAEWSAGQYDSIEVSEILTKALLGEREQLKSLGIAIKESDVQRRLAIKGQKELVGQALEQAKAIATLELITEKSADAQAAFAENTASTGRQLSQINARFKEAGESIVKFFAPAVQTGVSLLNKLVGGTNSYSESLEKERLELNKLIVRITTTNEKSDDRRKLVDQLQKQYPGFLKNLNAETVTNQQLTARLEEVNDQLINKIILQKEDEKIQKQAEVAADKKLKALEREDELIQAIVEESQENNIVLSEQTDLLAKAAELSEQLTGFDQRRVLVAARNFRITQSFAEGSLEYQNQLITEREELIKRLGIDAEETKKQIDELLGTDVTINPITPTSGGVDPEKEKKLQEQRLKDIAEAELRIQRLRLDLLEDTAAKRIAIIEFETEQEIEAIKGSEQQISEQRELLLRQRNQQIQEIEQELADNRVAFLNQRAQAEIQALTGTELEIAEDTLAIRRELANQLLEVRDDETQQRISSIISTAQTELGIFTGTEEEMLEYKTSLIRETNAQIIAVENEIREQRIEAAKQSAQDQIEALQGTEEEVAQQTLIIQEGLQKQIQEIEQAFADSNQISLGSQEQQFAEALANLEAYNQTRLLEIKQQIAAEAELAEDSDIPELEQKLQDQLLQQLKDYLQQRIELLAAAGEDTTALQEQLTDLSLDSLLNPEAISQEISSIGDAFRAYFDDIQNIFGVVNDLTSDYFARQAEEAEASYERQLEALEEAKARELSSVEQTEADKEKIEKRYDILRERAELELKRKKKDQALTQAAIDVATSILKTAAELGYPAAIPFQLQAAILGGIQIANISAEKFSKGGSPGGNQNTIPLTEAVGMAKAVKVGPQPGGVVSQPTLYIAGENYRREWIAPNWMLSHPETAQKIADLESIRVRGYETGGLSDGETIATTSPAQVDQTAVQTVGFDRTDQMIGLLETMIERFGEIQFVSLITEKEAAEIGDLQSEVESRRGNSGL